MTSAPNELLDQLHINNTQDLSPDDFADLINNSLVELKRTYNPLDTSNISTLLDEIREYPNLNINLTDTNSVLKRLKTLSLFTALGLDGIGNWILKEYTDVLGVPITHLLNALCRTEATLSMETSRHNTNSQVETSFQHQQAFKTNFAYPCLILTGWGLHSWKAHYPCCFEDNRSISVWWYPLFIRNPGAYLDGAFLGQGNRWNRKRCQSCPIFDLKDLHILAKKVSFLSMPLFVKRWVIDFLMNRQQLLLLVINDLQPP